MDFDHFRHLPWHAILASGKTKQSGWPFHIFTSSQVVLDVHSRYVLLLAANNKSFIAIMIYTFPFKQNTMRVLFP
jgi:hypothetical protein